MTHPTAGGGARGGAAGWGGSGGGGCGRGWWCQCCCVGERVCAGVRVCHMCTPFLLPFYPPLMYVYPILLHVAQFRTILYMLTDTLTYHPHHPHPPVRPRGAVSASDCNSLISGVVDLFGCLTCLFALATNRPPTPRATPPVAANPEAPLRLVVCDR